MRNTTPLQRREYVLANWDRYLGYLAEIVNSPYGPISMMEFACISANTAMEGAIRGWMAIRDLISVTDIAETLQFWGVNAPYKKAAYVVGIRQLPTELLPHPNRGDWRKQRETNVPLILGIGYAKYSFAACLSYPLDSKIVCLDTIMAQTLTGRIPDNSLYAATQKAHQEYERLENILLDEASKIGFPVFGFQWGVWDLTRKLVYGRPTEKHDFLWRKGPEHMQMVMNGLRTLD